MTGEIPLSSSRLEQGVPAADPEVRASFTSFDTAEVRPHAWIPSPVSSIGNSLLITLPMRHDKGSWPMEQGESSSEPSIQYAKRVLKSVLSSWIETLSSSHLEARFGVIKHV